MLSLRLGGYCANTAKIDQRAREPQCRESKHP